MWTENLLQNRTNVNKTHASNSLVINYFGLVPVVVLYNEQRRKITQIKRH